MKQLKKQKFKDQNITISVNEEALIFLLSKIKREGGRLTIIDPMKEEDILIIEFNILPKKKAVKKKKRKKRK